MPASTIARSRIAASGSHLAACAATWCGVHCALTPLFLAVAPALALSEGLETGAFGGTLLLGTLMLGLGPARTYVSILLTFAAGASLWAASLAGLLQPIPEAVTSATGSLMLAGALFCSFRVCKTDQCDVCAETESSIAADRAFLDRTV